MSIMFSFNFIKINLNKLNSIDDTKALLESNGIPIQEINPEKVFQSKKLHKSLFFDPTTHYLVAYFKKGDNTITFVPEFIKMMTESKPLSKKDCFNPILNLDLILDKINEKGFKSLDKNEINFLNKNSKK